MRFLLTAHTTSKTGFSSPVTLSAMGLTFRLPIGKATRWCQPPP